jgi:hypothetical protein
MADLFRHMYLPYCLMRLEDGSYVVTNRRYKPIGMTTTDHVTYEDLEVRVRFKRLTVATARALDHAGRESLERIYLYNDGCIPTSSDANWTAYSRRLQRLAGLKVEAAK